jgi:hypothetical protein
MLDYQPGQLVPILRAERDLARARLTAADATFAGAIVGLGQHSTPITSPTASSTTPHMAAASARVSYTHNRAGRGLHKEIRKAIAEAEQAGLRVLTFSGHIWGQLECPCGAADQDLLDRQEPGVRREAYPRVYPPALRPPEHVMIYEFTLVVDREPSQAELETLAAAGLDPIGAEGPHPALVHLAIDAGTLPAAIITAMRHIESLGVAVTAVQSADLVSLKDIAARTGRSYESVRKLAHGQRGPGGFPAPLSAGQWALCSWAEVSAWLARHYPATAAAATSYDREIAAADHLIRARHILPAPADRADLAQLLTA